jgi:crossover junction endodeoxyribonuclease RusA
MQLFELPWPPSINNYYVHTRNHTYIGDRGRDYRIIVRSILNTNKARKISGYIRLELELYPPDKRKRDMDNIQKALWDALQHGGLYEDDSQIKSFHCEMYEPMEGGLVVVKIRNR